MTRVHTREAVIMDHRLPAKLQNAIRCLADTVYSRRTKEIPALITEFARMFADEKILYRIIKSAERNVRKRDGHPDYLAALTSHLAAARESVPKHVALAQNWQRFERLRQRLASEHVLLVSGRRTKATALGLRLEPEFWETLRAATRQHRNVAGRLLAGQDRIKELAQTSLLPLVDPPPEASSKLGVLRIGSAEARQADARLVDAWKPNGGRSFPRQAARAAEHLMQAWLRTRFEEAHVHDLSICQVENGCGLPTAVAAALGRLGVVGAALEGPVALPADAAVVHGGMRAISFYDAKNTVKSRSRIEIFVRDGKLTRPGVTFVAIWTDGWIRNDQRDAWEALELPAVPTSQAAICHLNAVKMFVLGELDKRSLDAFLLFRDAAAPKVGVSVPSTVLDWTIEAGCLLPGLFFAFPEDAHAGGGSCRREAMRTAGLASRYVRTLSAAIIGALVTDTTPNCLADALELNVAGWFTDRLRLRDPSRRTAPPALGEVYLLTLQIFLEFLERQQGRSSTDLCRTWLERLPQLLHGLLLPARSGSDADFPLGAWDPSRSFRMLLQTLGRLVGTPEAIRDLPPMDRVFISRKGTVVATGPGRFRATLIARCKDCGEAPLVRGQLVVGLRKLPNGCKHCGRLLCSCLHGCLYEQGEYPEACLRRRLEADESN